MRSMQESAKNVSEKDIEETLFSIETMVRHPDRNIECYTAPTLETFCCAEVPSKKIDRNGNVTEETHKKQYLIGVPFLYVAGQAPDNFFRGEINHEVGHALYTDWKLVKEFKECAEKERYCPQEILDLNNCVEDPRMERVAGGPMRPGIQSDLFEKNRLLIIPSIAENISKGTPTEQFRFLLKLEGLWRIYSKELIDVKKPWDIEALHSEVQNAYGRVEQALARIVGNADTPALKLSKEYKRIFLENIWSVYKELINKFPEKEEGQEKQESKEDKEREEGKGEEGEGEESKEGKKEQGLKRGARSSEGKKTDPERDNFNPKDPSAWPPHLQKFLQHMLKQQQARLEQQAAQVRAEKERREGEFTIYKQTEHELLKHKDGFEDPQVREKYNALSAEIQPTTQAITRLFKRFFPKTEELEEEWGKQGKRFDVKRLVRAYDTGKERPLGKREYPQEKKFLFQIIVDVSGSMYSDGAGKRIENAVKGCIALAEAAGKANVDVEILASDEGNVKIDKAYLIKAFDEKFFGKTKERVIGMLNGFGGDNKDADSIRAAMERLKTAKMKAKAEAERVGTLAVFITDSTTQ